MADVDLTGRVIASQFRVERLLGKGGMGAVYLAEQLEMGRRVVVKVMHPSLMGAGADLEERFKREARIVAQMNHPNVVQVHLFGRTDDGQLYIAMEYIEGRTLTDLIEERGALPEARTMRILDQICSALIEAHDLGLVHRDLKPDNIMLTDRHGTEDYVKVLDFGIAKMKVAPDAKLTQTGAIFGTPQYMAPEQAQAKTVDQRTDIYALGLILYEMLTGQLPFSADSALEFLLKHISEPVEPPSRRISGLVVLPRTEMIVARALEKAPENRFQSVAEMQREVRQVLRDRPDAAKSFPTPERPLTSRTQANAALAPTMPPVVRRKPSTTQLALAGAGVLLVGLVGFKLVRRAQRNRPPQTDVLTQAPAVSAVDAYVVSEPPKREPPPPRQDPPPRHDPPPDPDPPPNPEPRVIAREPPPADPDVEAPPAGSPIEGLPVPRGAELNAATPQAVTLRTDLSAEKVLAFYRKHGQPWGEVESIPNGLQFKGARAPVTHVMLARTAGGLTISLTRNALAAVPPSTGNREDVFGVPLPPGAESTIRTGTTAVFQIASPSEEIVRFYRRHFQNVQGINFVETMVQGAPYLVITAEKEGLPFQNLAVMRTPDALKPGPGVWTQITLMKR